MYFLNIYTTTNDKEGDYTISYFKENLGYHITQATGLFFR